MNLLVTRALCGLLLLSAACSPTSEPGNERGVAVTQLSGPIASVGQAAQAPYLLSDASQNLFLSWTEVHGKQNELKFAAYTPEGWSKETIIASGQNWFVNWADYPVVATKNGENLLSHYLKKRDSGTYNYDIHLAYSPDSGISWNEAGILHKDNVPAEHGFVSMIPYKDNYLVAWLDGRNTASKEHDMSGHGAMTLRAAIVSVTGSTLQEWELDDRVCDCCQTSIALTREGPVVVYRNRSEEETRDMYITRLVEDEWTKPENIHADNWTINGCPVNGPRVATNGNQVAVAWFTGANSSPAVNLAFSRDNGASFKVPILLNQSKPVGRVDLVWLDDQQAFVTWMENEQIHGARISVEGKILERYLIATADSSRSSGFPQLAKWHDQLFVAWTNLEQTTINIRNFKP